MFPQWLTGSRNMGMLKIARSGVVAIIMRECLLPFTLVVNKPMNWNESIHKTGLSGRNLKAHLQDHSCIYKTSNCVLRVTLRSPLSLTLSPSFSLPHCKAIKNQEPSVQNPTQSKKLNGSLRERPPKRRIQKTLQRIEKEPEKGDELSIIKDMKQRKDHTSAQEGLWSWFSAHINKMCNNK